MSFRLVVALFLLTTGGARSALAQEVAWTTSVGAGRGSWRAATAVTAEVRPMPWLRLSAGPRLTRFGGETKSYRSPSDAAGVPGRLELAPAVWALNLAIGGEVRPLPPLILGGNLDLGGVAAGPARDASGLRVAPGRWSLFLYGDRDRGSLNSEAYVGLRFPAVTLRVGMSHFVTGYRTSGAGAVRYLRFDTVPFVSVSWSP